MRLHPLELPGAIYVCRNLREADRRELEATRDALRPDELAVQAVCHWGESGPAWLVVDGAGEPTAIFGATKPWPGMASAYMLATPNFPKVAHGLTKFVKRVFIPHLRETAHRVEARSIAGHDTAHRWLRALGATEEGRMVGYGKGGEDFIVFTLA